MNLLRDKKYYLLLVAALMVYLFFVKSDEILPIQEHSSQEFNKTVVDKVNQDKSSLISKVRKDLEVKEKKQAINIDAPIKVDEISYLSAFRKFTDFLLCKSAIEDWQKGELLKMFRQKLKEVRKFGFDGGKKHEEYYLLHFQHCKAYLLDEKETYADAFKRLQETYQNIEPKTEQEKQLAEIIIILDELAGLSSQLKVERKGISNLTNREIKNINKEIIKLSDLINPLFKMPEHKRTAEQTIFVEENYKKIVELRTILHESYSKDKETISQLGFNSDELKKSLRQKLIHIKSPDIFALMLMWKDQSYLTTQLRSFSDEIVKDIKVNLKFTKDNYPRHLAQASLPLFACALDYPCGSDSQLMTYYCIVRPIFKACGKNVEDFILDDYISPNIRTDAEDFLNLLFENYAQD